MTTLNPHILTLSVGLLLAGSGAIAQTNTITAPTTQEMISKLNAKDPATYACTSDAYELPWTPILERDIPWKKRLWRTIDTRDAANKAINTNLANVLVSGVMNGNIKAYQQTDDRFTKIMSKEELISFMTPGKGSNGFDPAQVVKYRIKEDWLYVAKNNTICVRIVGVAPVREVKSADGTITEEVMFWAYYPESRNYLAEQRVGTSSDTNWDQLFQARKFESVITKTSSPSGPYKQL